MTVTESDEYGQYEYAGVIVKAPNSPIYRLVAPDNSTVQTYDRKPSGAEAKQELLDGGYPVPPGSTVPYRDITIPDEAMPGDLGL